MKQHAYPGYDDLVEQFEYAAQIGMKFSPMMCQSLLETAETYAQEAQCLRQRNQAIEPLLVEIVARLRMPMMLGKVERQHLIERIERTLKHDTNEPAADGRTEVAE